jgi:DnaJ-domain-containing protein 1
MNKYAVLIGNSQFPDESDKSKLPDLACPVQDVDGLSKVLASERGEFDVLALKNEPSYKILRELQRKLKQATTDDLFLLYYSGHGKPNKSNILHLTTFDTVVAELATSAISMNRIYEILSEAKCRKIVIILDCCYSGAAGQGFKGAVDDQLQQLNNARGTYLVTASTELQVAHESAAEGLSLFTKHLIAGLETGEADKDGDGWVSMNELYDYVQSRVVAENPAQQPTKNVKKEYANLLIVRSGHDPRKERAEKIRLLLLELEKQDEGFCDIKAEVMDIVKIPSKELSTNQIKKDKLIERLFIGEITPVSFVKAWVQLSVAINISQLDAKSNNFFVKSVKINKNPNLIYKIISFLFGNFFSIFDSIFGSVPIGAMYSNYGVIDFDFTEIELEFSETQKAIFFTSIFTIIGKFMQKSGVDNKVEIDVIQSIIIELQLNEDLKEKAIEILYKSKEDYKINLSFVAQRFYDIFKNRNEHLIFIVICLFRIAKSNTKYLTNQENMILSIVDIFNIDKSVYLQIKEDFFPSLHKFYEVLGCNESDSNDNIKAKYRKLVRLYHPDKLISENLPISVVDLATNKIKEINQAYNVIKKERNF